MTMEEIDALARELKVQSGMEPSERPFDAMSMVDSTAPNKMAARRSEKAMSRPTQPLMRAPAVPKKKAKKVEETDQELKVAVTSLIEEM